MLSITRGTSCLCASFAISSISGMSLFGFPKVSMKTPLVFSWNAFSTSSKLCMLTKVVSIPCSGSVFASRLYEPPYILLCAMICPLGAASAWITYVIAAAPDESASAAMPPSRAAIRCSKTSCVGLVSLL